MTLTERVDNIMISLTCSKSLHHSRHNVIRRRIQLPLQLACNAKTILSERRGTISKCRGKQKSLEKINNYALIK